METYRKPLRSAGLFPFFTRPIWLQTQLNFRDANDGRIKRIAIIGFSALWLIVSLVRCRYSGNDTRLDPTWMASLAATFQQGWVSGREFHFTYGPLAQLLVWSASGFSSNQTALDNFTAMTFLGLAAGVLVLAMILLCLREISWQHTIVIYTGCALMNLFAGIFSFRLLMLLLTGACIHRAIVESRHRRGLWAAVAGLVTFIGQLVTVELGGYGVLAALMALVATLAVQLWRRDPAIASPIQLAGIAGTFIATFAAANLALSVIFFRTGPHYQRLMDYQRYALEMMRGYNNTAGLPWEMGAWQTAGFLIVAVYCVGQLVLHLLKGPPAHKLFLLCMTAPCLISLKSALVRSDLGHIYYAFTPMAFLVLLNARNWSAVGRWHTGLWLVVCALQAALWPFANLSAPSDLMLALRHKVSLPQIVRDWTSYHLPADKVVPPNLISLTRTGDHKPVLNFPWENYISMALRQPLITPVLQAHNAGTVRLQEFYLDTLQYIGSGYAVTYAVDNIGTVPLDGVQTVSRLPAIVQFLYTYFEVRSQEAYSGIYLLRRRPQAREIEFYRMGYTTAAGTATSGELRLSEPTPCAFIKLGIDAKYSLMRLLTKPAALQLTFWQNETMVATRTVVPLETGRPFSTLISLIDDISFYKLFGDGRVGGHLWNRLTYAPLTQDSLAAAPSEVRLDAIECVDPQRYYVDGHSRPETPISIGEEESLRAGSPETGFLEVASLAGEQPIALERIIKLSRPGGRPAYAEIPARPLALRTTTPLDGVDVHNVAIALANPHRVESTVRVTLTQDSMTLSRVLQLRGRSQIAQYLPEIFVDAALDGTIQGKLTTESEHPLASLVLQVEASVIREIEMLDSTPSQNSNAIVFPQVATKGGWATEIMLTNPTAQPLRGHLRFYSTDGHLQVKHMNGVAAEEFAYSLAPGETLQFTPIRSR